MSASQIRPEALAQTQLSPLAPTPTEVSPMIAAGEVLGSYEVERLLGRGGMGEVYAARHVRLGRRVALKVLRSMHCSRAEVVARFFQEARAVNEINHGHIVEIYDFVEERAPDRPLRVYLVMELLSGTSLADAMRLGPLPLERVASVAAQVADALEAAHRVGVVHRDVKPDNVFLTERGGQQDFVKVLDFGVAKLEQRPDTVTPETIEGMIIGTPAYMSPEQAAGTGTDARGDIYSLGIILYELLAGRLPFDAQNFMQLAMQIVSMPVPELPERAVSGEVIPSPLRTLVMACLQKDPANRPETMAAVAAALRDPDTFSGLFAVPRVTQTSTQPGLPPKSLTRTGGKRRKWALGATACALIAGALAIGLPTDPEPAPLPQPSVPSEGLVPQATATGPSEAAPSAPSALAAQETVAVPVDVALTLRSAPAGAKVVRADTGDALGVTPLQVSMPRGTGSTLVRVELSGYKPRELEVALDRDAEYELALEALPAKRRTSDPVKPDRRKELNRDAILDPYAN